MLVTSFRGCCTVALPGAACKRACFATCLRTGCRAAAGRLPRSPCLISLAAMMPYSSFKLRPATGGNNPFALTEAAPYSMSNFSKDRLSKHHTTVDNYVHNFHRRYKTSFASFSDMVGQTVKFHTQNTIYCRILPTEQNLYTIYALCDRTHIQLISNSVCIKYIFKDEQG
jgi:hypothetical protein